MNKPRLRRMVVLTLTLSLLLAAPARHASAEGPDGRAGEGEKLAVSLRTSATEYNRDGTYGSTSSTGIGDAYASYGGSPALVYVGTGWFGPDGKPVPFGMCMSGTGAADIRNPIDAKAKLLHDNADLWWAEVRALPAEIGRVSLEVTWEHQRSERQGEPRRVAGDTRKILMNEGEHHVLDFLDEVPAKEAYCYRNHVLDVSARVEEDPEVASRRLHYDLWLQHETADGKRIHRRFTADAKQGEEISFRLTPLRFGVPGIALEDGRGMDAILDVSGAIRGRLRRDGRIDLRMQALRYVGVAPSGEPRLGGIGEGGNQVFSVRPGETVGLPLPAPHGSIGLGKPENAKIDAKEFFAGSQDEMILTIREAR